jgi:nucleotide-binding universal stress UspA family protein
MLRKILIATDGSPASAAAVDLGLELACEQGAEAILVHVVPPIDIAPSVALGFAGALDHDVTDDDTAALATAARAALARGVAAEALLLRGDVVDEIVACADSVDDLTVVGSRGRGPLAAAVLGSVSRGVLDESRRPVLVARSHSGGAT